MTQNLVDMIVGIYRIGYNFWTSIVGVAMNLFTVDPLNANGTISGTVKNLYDVLEAGSVTIALIFFLIALLKEVISAPPDQQIRKFFGDFIRFGIMIAILANLWTIMGTIMQVANNITSSLAFSGSYEISVDDTDLPDIIADMLNEDNFEEAEVDGFLEKIAETAKKWGSIFIVAGVSIIAAVATLIIMVACAISIVNSAIQRIIKPLVILPFSCITVALASGAGDASRVTSAYLKTFFGFCISGAFMVIAVNLGSSIATSLINVTSGSSAIETAINASLQAAIMPLVISGLIKSIDSIIARFF